MGLCQLMICDTRPPDPSAWALILQVSGYVRLEEVGVTGGSHINLAKLQVGESSCK